MMAEAGIISNLFFCDEPNDFMRHAKNGINIVLSNNSHSLIDSYK